MSGHRWAVDSIENGIARVEEDGARMITVPLHLLPDAVKEGHVLRVDRGTGSGKESLTLTISIDEGATASAVASSKKQTATAMDASRKRDKGGDVAL
jgi:hypothetical protein